MAIKTDLHQIKGMQKDFSVSKASNEFAFDAMNIRLTAREGNTLLSITNEKGNKEVKTSTLGSSVSIEGTVIGHSVINQYLVLFTTGTTDNIYRLEKRENHFEVTLLYTGDLGFDIEHPIESIGTFENEDIQKVYWIDGINPVRFINITKVYNGNSDIFNFAQDLSLKETSNIKCNNEVKGSFPSGVVQYAFTYYNKNGAETNIFYQSPLYYSHRYNRGGSPEEVASNSFDIELNNLDIKFDYIRIYSITRTSIDATPTVKQVADLSPKSGSILYTDTNTTGETVDPTLLLYIGGENIIPECITHKDNTLFLGNYKLKQEAFSDTTKNSVKTSVSFDFKETEKYELREGMYDYTTQLNQNSYQITTLKARETYRFGIQFQNKIGRWSEVLYIGDYKVSKNPSINVHTSEINIKELQSNTLIKGEYIIPSSVIADAVALGYVKARGVIVYPSNSDKDIICQGILNPTVYKADDRESKSPYAQSSWFFRPYVKPRYSDSGLSFDYSIGSIANYTDSRNVNYNYEALIDGNTIDVNIGRRTEIGTTLSYTEEGGTIVDRDFYVDANIVTMHSPDIEFNDAIDSYSDSKLNCNIIGYVHINNCQSFRDVQASTPSADVTDFGFYDKFPYNINPSWFTLNSSGGMLISGINWIGKAIDASDDSWKSVDRNLGWLVSPWQRSGSLINDFAKRADSQVVSKLKHNRLINTRVSYETIFGLDWSPVNGITNIAVFDSNEQSLVYVGEYAYYGNIDKVLTPGSKTYGNGAEVGYSRTYTANSRSTDVENEEDNPDDTAPDDGDSGGGGSPSTVDPSAYKLYRASVAEFSGSNIVESSDYLYSRDPVSMKYKSTKHAVFAFNPTNGLRTLLPALEGASEPHTIDSSTYYDTLSTNHNSILWIAELSREVPRNIKFGGNTSEAILNNRWHIAGESVSIVDNNNVALSSATIEYLQGDTYFQRYDCMKTYPYTLEDENSVTEILSFYCETRVNVDGRYDRNRKSFNNLALTPTNFNLINPVYTQTNNFFNYFTLDPSLRINEFNNSLTWSKEKSLGEQIDQWTNITLASTLDLDGDRGEITALKTFNNEIFCFQKQGISNILFNSRVQIPTSDGVPIEITNGLKVQGKRYLSSIGCSNKWSIAESPVGLYFIDSNTDEIYLFNGQITSLSTQLGFSQYAKEHNHLNKWNPYTFNNFRTHYDKNNGDVYFIDKDSCLVYSETIGQFTSFMSYEKTPYMFNIDNSFYAIKDNKVWKQFAGDYNSFYGEVKPYSITVISNPDSFYDKVFNNIEFRADTWDNDKLLNTTFDTLEVWNEYQYGKTSLVNTLGRPSSLKKKFRVWRANIPRDSHNMRDRIRNTWAYVKLEYKNPSNYKTEFHDLMVHYFV